MISNIRTVATSRYAYITAAPITTGASVDGIARLRRLPIPGQPNTTSVIIAPCHEAIKAKATLVIIGALRV